MKNKIKVLREQKKLSQKRLAELIGTSQQQIQRIETGVHSVRFDLALSICDALETPLQTVFPETRKVVSVARKTGRNLNHMWADRDLSRQMENAGIGMDPHTWYFRYRLRGGAEGILPLAGSDKDYLWHQLHRTDSENYFVVFDSGETRVLVNLNHLIYGHIVWEVPRIALDDQHDGEWDALGFGLQGHTLSVYLVDSSSALYFTVEPDEPLEGDLMEDEGQFRLLVSLVKFALQEDTDEVFSFDGDEEDTIFLRASDIAMIKIPWHVLYPDHWEGED